MKSVIPEIPERGYISKFPYFISLEVYIIINSDDYIPDLAVTVI